MITLLHDTDGCDLDADQIVQEKIKENNDKYPVKKATARMRSIQNLLNK